MLYLLVFRLQQEGILSLTRMTVAAMVSVCVSAICLLWHPLECIQELGRQRRLPSQITFGKITEYTFRFRFLRTPLSSSVF